MSQSPQLDHTAIRDIITRLEEFELEDYYQGNGILDLIDGVIEGYPACVFAHSAVALGKLSEENEPECGL